MLTRQMTVGDIGCGIYAFIDAANDAGCDGKLLSLKGRDPLGRGSGVFKNMMELHRLFHLWMKRNYLELKDRSKTYIIGEDQKRKHPVGRMDIRSDSTAKRLHDDPNKPINYFQFAIEVVSFFKAMIKGNLV